MRPSLVWPISKKFEDDIMGSREWYKISGIISKAEVETYIKATSADAIIATDA